jgi:hypothetical protein
VNFAGLENAIQQAQNILTNASDYVPSSIVGLADETTAALAVFNNKSSTQAQVNAASLSLTAKILNARLKADKSPILNALGILSALDLNLYTPQSVQPLAGLTAEAQAVLEDDEVTSSEINALAERILQAISALVRVSDTQSGGGSAAAATTTGGGGGTAAVASEIGEAAIDNPVVSGTEAAASSGSQSSESPITDIDPVETPLSGSDGAQSSASVLPWIIGAAALILLGLIIMLAKRRKVESK